MAEEAKEWYGHFVKAAAEIKELRARLAEVEALCDRMRAIYKDCPPSWVDAVRAAARGEGGRG